MHKPDLFHTNYLYRKYGDVADDIEDDEIKDVIDCINDAMEELDLEISDVDDQLQKLERLKSELEDDQSNVEIMREELGDRIDE